MSNALQERAVERLESFVPSAVVMVDPERPSTYSLRLFQVWDQEGRVRARFTTDHAGEFVGGTVLVDGVPLGYQDLTAFLVGLKMGGGW